MSTARIVAGVRIDPKSLAAAVTKTAREFEARQGSREAGRVLELKLAAGIPGLFVDATLEGFKPETEAAERLLRAYVQMTNRVINGEMDMVGGLFVGPAGTGKTHIACALANKLIENGFTAAYTTLPRLTLNHKHLNKQLGMSGLELVARYRSVDLLILDEIDLHAEGDQDYQMLYEIINSRYEGGLPTIAISNRDVSTLTRDLNERLVSRITMNAPAIPFNWPSKRGFAK